MPIGYAPASWQILLAQKSLHAGNRNPLCSIVNEILHSGCKLFLMMHKQAKTPIEAPKNRLEFYQPAGFQRVGYNEARQTSDAQSL